VQHAVHQQHAQFIQKPVPSLLSLALCCVQRHYQVSQQLDGQVHLIVKVVFQLKRQHICGRCFASVCGVEGGDVRIITQHNRHSSHSWQLEVWPRLQLGL